MSKAYKNLFDFIYSVLGYSPGGVYENGVMTFNSSNLNPDDFLHLQTAFSNYQTWFDQSGEKPEKRIPTTLFSLEMGVSTFAEKMLVDGYVAHKTGDTRFWQKN